MEKAKIKLFGVKISVSANDEQVVLHNSTPSEYSPTPTGERRRLSLLDQEARLRHHQNDANFVSAADQYHVKDALPTLGFLSATRSLSSSQVSRKSPAAKKRAFDEIDHDFDNINNLLLPFKKRFSAAEIFPAQVGGGMVDRTLLPTTGFGSTADHGRSPSSDDGTSRKFPSKKTAFHEINHPSSSSSSTCDHGILDDSKVYSPMPLRCFPPINMILEFPRKKNRTPKSTENKKKKKENSLAIDKSIPPVLPLENIPGLMERIGSQNGSTKPVFLFKKKMEESDVRPHLNRLFIPGSKIELMEFLSEEERASITSETRKGLEFVGIDKNGESYNLRLVKWDSLRMTVVNKEWMKMVSANNVQKGDWVELWGYRANNNEFRLVINFRKSETRIGSSSGSTCTTNLGD